jgi:hypothetical protein
MKVKIRYPKNPNLIIVDCENEETIDDFKRKLVPLTQLPGAWFNDVFFSSS